MIKITIDWYDCKRSIVIGAQIGSKRWAWRIRLPAWWDRHLERLHREKLAQRVAI